MEENKRVEEVRETKEVEFGEIRFQGDLIPYKTSKTTDKIDAALVEFNKEVESIERSEINPFYKNFYCTLDQIISYVRPILAKHDLFIQQFPQFITSLPRESTLLGRFFKFTYLIISSKTLI